MNSVCSLDRDILKIMKKNLIEKYNCEEAYIQYYTFVEIINNCINALNYEFNTKICENFTYLCIKNIISKKKGYKKYMANHIFKLFLKCLDDFNFRGKKKFIKKVKNKINNSINLFYKNEINNIV